jgi:hypothetical protein
MDFCEIWNGRYAIVDKFNLIISNFLHPVLRTWRMVEVVRWNDDDNAITHDPLRMCINSLA